MIRPLLTLFGSLFGACQTEPTSTSPPPAATPPNIVLISIDGLRADRTHFGGNPRPTSPNLDILARDGVVFTRAFSQSNESLLSHAALFTGRYPSEIARPVYTEFLLPDTAVTLPEMLTQVGYDTAAFIAGGHIQAAFGFGQGFATFFETEKRFGSFFETTPAAITWLGQRPSTAPFFLFLHGYDCHRPYVHDNVFFHPFTAGECTDLDRLFSRRNISEYVYEGKVYADFEHTRILHANGEQMLNPGDYMRLPAFAANDPNPDYVHDMTPEMIDHVVQHYDAAVLAADAYIGLFLEHLQVQGLWDDTIVIVTSDHGEDLQDHGYFNHRTVLFDSTTRVPLVISGGALQDEYQGRVVTVPVDAIDIIETIAEWVGTEPPAGSRGESLWAALDPNRARSKEIIFQQGVLGQTAARDGRYRLVFSGYHLTDPTYLDHLVEDPIDGGHFALYDTVSDPKELRDIVTNERDVAEALRQELARWWAPLSVGTDRLELTPEQREMLQRHGYW